MKIIKKYIIYLFFLKNVFSIDPKPIIGQQKKNTILNIMNQKNIKEFFYKCSIFFNHIFFYLKPKQKNYLKILLKNEEEEEEVNLEEKIDPKEELEVNLCLNHPTLATIIKRNTEVANNLRETYFDNRNNETLGAYFTNIIFKNIKTNNLTENEIITLYRDYYADYSEFFKYLIDDIVIELIEDEESKKEKKEILLKNNTEEEEEEEERLKDYQNIDLVQKDIEFLRELLKDYNQKRKNHDKLYLTLEKLVKIKEFKIAEENPNLEERENRNILIAEITEIIEKELITSDFLMTGEKERYKIIIQRFKVTYLKEKDEWDKFITEVDNLTKEYERKKSEEKKQLTQEELEKRILQEKIKEKYLEMREQFTPGQ